jgi:hypothetical protein
VLDEDETGRMEAEATHGMSDHLEGFGPVAAMVVIVAMAFVALALDIRCR